MNIKELQASLNLVATTLDDYPILQNMARFYVYDLSRDCGFTSEDWACPSDGLYESFDFKTYFEDPTRKAYFIKVGNELAGFALLNQEGHYPNTDWNMGEFFILAKFQRKGIANLAAAELWKRHPGVWEVSVIPENTRGLFFWEKSISRFTAHDYQEEVKTVKYDTKPVKRIIFRFDTRAYPNCDSLKTQEEYKIRFVDEIDATTEKRMSHDLVAYETSHGIDVNYRRFSITISNQNGHALGVINAFTAFAEIYVDDIWVDRNHRSKGLGRQLLIALENHFKGQGFNNINLVTSAFQAPEFYRKCGFTAEFTRINKKNPLLSKTFFVKFFNEEIETQGLVKHSENENS
ncbi:GNAT family N-acetyltransferase [Legionella waltersii]|uniref:N-acetyltransferase GCN5 n=1 Tax=Legionella waltersii TaxID=66969 RepID=A0A0W1A0V7_9GAMM|nr:GNAT family N-acetyltransferase [Legionella waltersii]KTD74952.1 N-acetyltransferase GCN5 [Legionella waltersii]SNV08526.1 acyl-CoA N-acyltransferase [Legionella waltersii]